MPIMARIRSAFQMRAAYRRTKRDLERMPLDVALDLDLYPGDARQIARQAVYG